jgi:hypothetical protein
MAAGADPDRALSDFETAFFDAIEPERVVPLVAFFASRDCAVTHHHVSAAAGRYARAFTGLTEGWFADPQSPPPSLEDVAAHYAQISSTDGFAIPLSATDEITGLATTLGIA